MRVEIEPGVRLFFDVEGPSHVPDENGAESDTGAKLREKPTLVLLHGGPGMDHSGWKPRMSALAERRALGPYLQICLPLYNPTPQPDATGARAKFDVELLNTWNRTELPQLNLLPGLARAACPVLVMGGEQDPVTPIQDPCDIAAALPAQWVQFERFAGAGHGIWRDRPEAAMAALRRFIIAPDRDLTMT